MHTGYSCHWDFFIYTLIFDALRKSTIEHQRWYEVMIKKIFGSKAIMRYELTLRPTMYNSFSAYARYLRLPFKQTSALWKHLDDSMKKNLFFPLADKGTKKGRKERANLERRLDVYEPTGPLI